MVDALYLVDHKIKLVGGSYVKVITVKMNKEEVLLEVEKKVGDKLDYYEIPYQKELIIGIDWIITFIFFNCQISFVFKNKWDDSDHNKPFSQRNLVQIEITQFKPSKPLYVLKCVSVEWVHIKSTIYKDRKSGIRNEFFAVDSRITN